MKNPVLIEVKRGGTVESTHTGAIAVCEPSGGLRVGIGDTGRHVFPRSAIKALQAIPVIESGASERFNFSARELALACSSHNGEETHVRTVREMIAKIGLDESVLGCGTQWPKQMPDMANLHRNESTPTQLHNNCSGKHAGILATAVTLGYDVTDYTSAEHPVQKVIRDVLTSMTGFPHSSEYCGVDGCSIPTHPVPLSNLAAAFACFGLGGGILSNERERACKTLYESCVNEPFMVAGTDRFCSEVMQVMQGRVFAKTGAEGVFCGAIPELAVGIALKCDDGSTRGSEAMMAAIIEHMLELNEDQSNVLIKYSRRPILTRKDNIAGMVEPDPLFKLLQTA